jgi:putative membrane protein
MSVLFACLHHVCAFFLVAILFAQGVLLKTEITLALAKKIQKLDLLYGLLAVALVLIGGLRAVYFEKGWAYYQHSPWFMWKMTAFVAVALLSAYPTVRFLLWRKLTARGELPLLDAALQRRLLGLIYAQAIGVLAIIVCAAAMAKGGF